MRFLVDDRLEESFGNDRVFHDEVTADMVDGPLSHVTLTDSTKAEFGFIPE